LDPSNKTGRKTFTKCYFKKNICFIFLSVEDIVLNLDLAPTFLEMAGVEIPPHMDGRSILKLLHPHRGLKRIRWPDTFLIESSGRRDADIHKARHKILQLATEVTGMKSLVFTIMLLT